MILLSFRSEGRNLGGAILSTFHRPDSSVAAEALHRNDSRGLTSGPLFSIQHSSFRICSSFIVHRSSLLSFRSEGRNLGGAILSTFRRPDSSVAAEALLRNDSRGLTSGPLFSIQHSSFRICSSFIVHRSSLLIPKRREEPGGAILSTFHRRIPPSRRRRSIGMTAEASPAALFSAFSIRHSAFVHRSSFIVHRSSFIVHRSNPSLIIEFSAKIGRSQRYRNGYRWTRRPAPLQTMKRACDTLGVHPVPQYPTFQKQ